MLTSVVLLRRFFFAAVTRATAVFCQTFSLLVLFAFFELQPIENPWIIRQSPFQSLTVYRIPYGPAMNMVRLVGRHEV